MISADMPDIRSPAAALSDQLEQTLRTAIKLKAVMVKRGLTRAKADCPRCKTTAALHGLLVKGPAAGRHRNSGGAFRMWCDGCDLSMME